MLAQLRSAELREFSSSDFRENREKPTKEKISFSRFKLPTKLITSLLRAVHLFEVQHVSLFSPCYTVC